jgi:hypothetical protein
MTYTSLEHHLQETGHTKPNMPNTGRPQSHRSADVEDVLHAVGTITLYQYQALACCHRISQ